MRSRLGIPAAATIAIWLAVAGVSQAADFTWSGAAPPDQPFWSNGSNWVGGTAPARGGSVGTLTFPLLNGSACTPSTPCTLYSSTNDLPGLSANAISIDDGGHYVLSGNLQLMLGAGGITATTSATTGGGVAIFHLPLKIDSDQTWSVSGNFNLGRVDVQQLVTDVAPGHVLAIHLANQAALHITGTPGNSGEIEVGPVSIVGGKRAGSPGQNGAVVLSNGSLNGTTDGPITLSHASLAGTTGHNGIGDLTAVSGEVRAGVGTVPAGALAFSKSLHLDSGSTMTLFINGSGTTAGTDFSVIDAAGNVDLGNAHLSIMSPGGCPALTPGQPDTLIRAAGTLAGTFAGVPNGTRVPIACPSPTPPKVEIDYTAHSVTAKVPVPPPTEGIKANVAVEKGTVLIKLPAGTALPKGVSGAATNGFVKLTKALRQIPLGSTLDTTHGQVKLLTAANKHRHTQTGHFSNGVFIVQQSRTNPLTTLSMTGASLSSCEKLPHGGSPKATAAAARSRSLFANVKGRFRVRGRNSAASVRGTEFLVKDTCSGTLTSVRRGTVIVRDFTLKKNVTVKAGHQYLARPPKKK